MANLLRGHNLPAQPLGHKVKSSGCICLGVPIALITAFFLFVPAAYPQTSIPDKNNHLLILYYPLITAKPKGRFVTKANFTSQMEMLKSSGYCLVGLKDVMDFYYRNKPLPEKAVLITFSGSRGNFLYAGPVLKKLGLKAAIFLNIRAMKKGSHSEVSWHDLAIMKKGEIWSLAIDAKTEDEAIESKRYLEKRLQSVSALIRPYGIEIEKVKTAYIASFMHTYSDGYNTKETSPYSLNMIIVSSDWDGKGLIYFLDNAASRQGRYIGDFSKPSIASDWLNPYGLAFVQDGKLNLQAGPFKNGAQIWLVGTRNWSDCGISAEFRIRRGSQFWIYARYKDDRNYIRFGQDNGYFYLQQRSENAGAASMKSEILKEPGAVFHKIKFIVKGSYCLAYLDDKKIFRQPLSIDASLDHGKIGLSAWSSSPGLAHCQIAAIEAGELKITGSDYPDLTDKAVEDIRKKIADAKGHLDKGEGFYQSGAYQQALKEFQLAVEKDPDSLKGWENAGWAYWRINQIDDTIKAWKKLESVNPDDPKILNLLAKAYIEKKDYQAVLSLYERILELEPGQQEARLNLARAKGWMRKYNEALSEMRQLLSDYPEDTEIGFQLAKSLINARRYAEAEKRLAVLMAQDPENRKYKIESAKVLYYGKEKYQEALDMLAGILKDEPNNTYILAFLADDAIFRRDYMKACEILNKITYYAPDNIPALNKLARIYFELEDYKKSAESARRILEIKPRQIAARLLYADALRLKESLNQAEKEYRHVLSLNPNNFPARIGLKEIYLEKNDFSSALRELDHILATDRSNISLMIEKAKILAYKRDYHRSIKELNELLSIISAKKPVLALLYHGITTARRSDILQLSNFKAQMAVLKENGYTSITTEDLVLAVEGKKLLPDNPVLITFDDARRDSFIYADPVLKENGFKAVMFVPLSIAEKGDPLFSDYAEMNYYKDTGRWDLQSHGNFSHEDIAIDDRMTPGVFLANKRWLSEQNRLETSQEYTKRIDSDNSQAKQKLETLFKAKIYAFAFPEGDIGQTGYSNCKEAVKSNLYAASKHYDLGFIQDGFGFNFLDDSPYLLKRFEVPADYSGSDFRRHINTQTPIARIKLLLANVLRWSGSEKAALKLYDQLIKAYPDNEGALMSKALLNREALKPGFQSSFYHFGDNKGRQVMKWQEGLKYILSTKTSLETAYARAVLKGEGVVRIGENEYSLSAYYKEGLRSLRLAYFYREFSSANNAHNFLADLKFPLLFINNVDFVSSYENVESAKAVQAGAKMLRNSVALYKELPYNFSLYGKFQHNGYNDDNARDTVNADLYYLLFRKPNISVGYEFTYDNTKFSSSNYYSPDNLMIHQAGLRLKKGFFKDSLSCDIGYGLGYATEEGVKGRLIHSTRGYLRWAFTAKAELFASFDLSRTSTYASQNTQVGLKYSF